MGVVAYQHRPVLRRVRVGVDLLCDHLSKVRVLIEPLASDTSDWMPANFDGSQGTVKGRVRDRDGIWLMSKANSVFEGYLAFAEIVSPTYHSL